MIIGDDDNIYAAGEHNGAICVVSLTYDGVARWANTFWSNAPSAANSIVYGSDHNIYVGGYGTDTNKDILIMSLDTAGAERWTYHYNGNSNGDDVIYDIGYGPDGNVYAAGYINGVSDEAFTVVSLDTAGNERWIYTYDSNAEDIARAIAFGTDSTIYVAGQQNWDIAIVSLTTSGTENWKYRKISTAGRDRALDVICGSDGNIYATGTIYMYVGIDEMHMHATMSVTESGTERWFKTANWDSPGPNIGYALVYGDDNNIYSTGQLYMGGTQENVTVVSRTNTGGYRFTYFYQGLGCLGYDCGRSIVYGADGNIYVTGVFNDDLIVLSITSLGVDNWDYTYNLGSDIGYAICYGSDSNIYIAGKGGSYLTVISLEPPTGIVELVKSSITPRYIRAPTYFKNTIRLDLKNSDEANLEIRLYTNLGELVLSKNFTTPAGLIELTDSEIARLAAGVYFLVCKNRNISITKKLIKLR